jgi:mannose-6-phosphate isomerase class I
VPRGLTGVLRTIDWRTDLTGLADLRITVEYSGEVWTGFYPGSPQVRAEVGQERLQQLHRILSHSLGQDMAYVAGLEVG